MKQIRRHKSASERHFRSNQGQALLGGTALISLMSMLAVGLLILLVNFSVLGNYNERLQGVASEIAERAAAQEWQFGVEREYDPDAIQARASDFANDRKFLEEELKVLGVNSFMVTNFRVERTDAQIRNLPIKLYTVSFDVFGLPLYGGMLPALMPLHVVGSSSNYSEHAEQRHGSALILAIDPAKPEIRRGIRVPIYNATVGHNTPAHPTVLHMGPMVGQPPEAYFRLECPHAGYVNPSSF